MTPERLAEIDDIIEFESDMWKVEGAMRELRAHIEAQAKQIEQLQADKSDFDDFVDYIKTYRGKHVWQDYQEWKAK